MNPSQIPTMSFYHRSQTNSSVPEFYFNYSFVANKTATSGNINSQFLVFNAPLGSSIISPDILAITYNIQTQAISANCAEGLCAFGNYSTAPYLSFTNQVSYIVPYKTKRRSDIMYCCTRGQQTQLMPMV